MGALKVKNILLRLWARPTPPVEVKKPRWDPAWDKATAVAAYEESLRIQEIQSQWSDAIDTKVAGVFALASVIVTLSPTLGLPQHNPVALALWKAAAVFWLLSSVCCYVAFRPTALEIGPDPSGLLERRWMQLTAHEYRLFRMSEMGESYVFNRRALSAKARWLRGALAFAVVEVFLLLLAFALCQS